jgi:hypothetical protein
MPLFVTLQHFVFLGSLMTQAFQLAFLVAVDLGLLALYKEHSTGKAGNVYLLSNGICLLTTTILLFL